MRKTLDLAAKPSPSRCHLLADSVQGASYVCSKTHSTTARPAIWFFCSIWLQKHPLASQPQTSSRSSLRFLRVDIAGQARDGGRSSDMAARSIRNGEFLLFFILILFSSSLLSLPEQ